MSEFLHDPPAFVVSKREWHYAGRRCLSWRKNFDIAKVDVSSDISSVCVCVCVRVRACGIKETFVHLKCVFIFFEFYTPMHAPIHRSEQCH